MLKLNHENEKKQDEMKKELKSWLRGVFWIIGSLGQVVIPEFQAEFEMLRIFARQLAWILANVIMFLWKKIRCLLVKAFWNLQMLLIIISLLWKRNF